MSKKVLAPGHFDGDGCTFPTPGHFVHLLDSDDLSKITAEGLRGLAGNRCPVCGDELVEVDNPFRREVRHRRGVTCEGQ